MKWHDMTETPVANEPLVVLTDTGYEVAYWLGNTFFSASSWTTRPIIREVTRWAELETT